MMKSALLACVFTFGVVAAAEAGEPAFVNKFGGSDVAVLRGETVSGIAVQTQLQPGDRVSAGKGSFVEVKYVADGCAIRVSAGHSLVIGAASPCAAADHSAEATPSKGDKLPAGAQIVPVDAVIAAGSAQVINQTGSITRVNRGDGLVELSVGQDLSVGDTVFAGPGSTITLYYPAMGCEYVVPSETYFAVASTAPCATTADVGAGSGLQRTSTGIAGVTTGSGTIDTTTVALVAGTVVVAGVALAAVALSGEDGGSNNNPASPD